MSWPYVAGFFDGEGHVGMTGKNIRVTLTQKEPEVLRAMQGFLLNMGIQARIQGWFLASPRNKIFRIEITRRDSIKEFLSNVRPYTIVKKQWTEDMWRFLSIYPLMSKQLNGKISVQRREMRKRNSRNV